jgi:hypothetical protein
MKNPILSIRKGAEVYDDSLAESERRLQAAEAAALRHPPAKRRRPHARRARMTFLPLVVLAIGLVVVFRIIPRPPTNRAGLAGWDAVLRATPYGNTLLLSVTFIHGTASSALAPEIPPAIASVRFFLQGTGERLTLEEALVKSPMTIRGQLPWSASVKKVQAEVSVGAEKKTLTLAARAAP